MIIVNITGGLGNQMFQYAIGRSLSYKNNCSLLLDISYYNNQGLNTKREYQLDIFNIKSSIASKKDIIKITKFAIANQVIEKIINKLKLEQYFNIVRENRFSFDASLIQTQDNSYLIGYFQTEKYFKDIRNQILTDFTLKKEYIKDETVKIREAIKAQNSISIHVRRGDYISNKLTNQYHGTAELEYYRKAVDIINREEENPVFYIFSDDIDWCKDNFNFIPQDKINFISGNKDYIDLELMKSCKHNIIANSSFSWWAAWLNENQGKIVIAPKKWFNDISIDTSDIIPDTWLKI